MEEADPVLTLGLLISYKLVEIGFGLVIFQYVHIELCGYAG